MALEVGTRLGHYDVTSLLGEGGMGQVWQATDTQLGREVALKILPDAFAADPDRLARFTREAQILASLNHPNIAAIYGIEEAEGTRALVLELVEGPTLADRISKGPIPLDEALPIAKQIAEALEAAHEQGVIHRDLKPANIKVKDDGTVKVLDFGLAKAFQPDASDPNLSISPTISLTAAATQMGMVIGTAAYMAPEQAKGKVVDKRADVWAFGAVVYEMLTGTRAFVGDDVSDTLAAVLRAEVNLEGLPEETPGRLRQVLRACLQRDPKQRVQAIGDVRLAMEGTFETTVGTQSEPEVAPQLQLWQRPIPLALAGLALLGLGGLAVWSLTRLVGTPPSLPTRFALTLPSDVTIGIQGLAMSPDGRTVVFDGGSGAPGGLQLYRRRLDELEATPIPGTENGQLPFFSPDGLWVGFFASGTLKKVSLDGRPPVTLCVVPGGRRGASWASDDTILFNFGGSNEMWRVAAAGGEAEPLAATTDPDPGVVLRWPDMLPDGSAALVTVWAGGLSDAQVGVVSLATGELTPLVAGSSPRYSPTGHIVYWREDSLWAVPFDTQQRKLTGAAAPVVEDVRANQGGLAHFALGDEGSLVYGPGGTAGRRTLVWVDREGQEEPMGVTPRTYSAPRVSPDGTQLAFRALDGEDDIWTYHLGRQTSQRLTYHPSGDGDPVWTADGTKVAFFAAGRDGGPGVFWKAADGTGDAERLSTGAHGPASVSPDGTRLLFADRGSGLDIGWLLLDGDPNPEPLYSSSFNETGAVVSPDGEWMAYEADDSGRFEVYVRPFPNVDDGRWQVSTAGGAEPVWGPAGRELFGSIRVSQRYFGAFRGFS